LDLPVSARKVIALQIFNSPGRFVFGQDAILHTSDISEAEGFVNRSVTPDKRQFTLLGKSDLIDIDLSTIELEKTRVYGCKFGDITVNVKTEPLHSAHLIIPLKGSLFNHVLGTAIRPGELAFFQPGSLIDMDWRNIKNSVVFSVSNSQIERHLNKLIDQKFSESCCNQQLQQKFSLTDPKISGLVNVINTIHVDSVNGRSLLNNPLCRTSLEHMLMECISALIPYAEEKNAKRLIPGRLKVAIDYIEKNKHRSISVDELSTAAKCSRRSLENSFHLAFGLGPNKYISHRRMHAIRKALETNVDPGKTVTDIAADFGYYNLSYFTKLYREKYGETPAQTLNKTKKMQGSVD
jgi:AraC-like DNA-binding protein